MGNLSVARQLLEEGLELHPRFLQAHVALARVERLSGNLEEAQQILRKAAKVRACLWSLLVSF
jgi:Tfp pilus assembly protein PilF